MATGATACRCLPAFALAAQAVASPCLPAQPEELVFADRSHVQTADFPAPDLHTVGSAETKLRIRLWRRDDAHSLRLLHDYRAYQLRTPAANPPQTNGHLHRLALAYRFATANWEWTFAPVLAASSNAGQHPRAIDSGLVAWHGVVRYRHDATPSVDVFWGACRDDRLGAVSFHPLLGIAWRVQDRVNLTLAFPDSRLSLRLHPRWRLQAGIHPAGGSWRIFDDDLVRRSRFQQQGWRISLGLALQAGTSHRLVLHAGREYRRSFRFRLREGSDVEADVRNAALIGIRWQWLRR